MEKITANVMAIANLEPEEEPELLQWHDEITRDDESLTDVLQKWFPAPSVNTVSTVEMTIKDSETTQTWKVAVRVWTVTLIFKALLSCCREIFH